MICNFICTFAQKNRTLHYIAYTSKTGNKAQHSSVYKRVVSNANKIKYGYRDFNKSYFKIGENLF